MSMLNPQGAEVWGESLQGPGTGQGVIGLLGLLPPDLLRLPISLGWNPDTVIPGAVITSSSVTCLPSSHVGRAPPNPVLRTLPVLIWGLLPQAPSVASDLAYSLSLLQLELRGPISRPPPWLPVHPSSQL